MEADFSGWATKAGLKCSDGRTIMRGAFRHQHQAKVPLVWQHGHNDPENVLGHALLEDRDEGTYAYAFLNKTAKAKHAAELLEHGDINRLSIWANQLVERAGNVIHGSIREVSLVLSGANPGAVIENVTIRHGDGVEDTLDDEVIIKTGLPLEHAQADTPPPADDNSNSSSDDTLEDIYNSMDEKQKNLLHFMVKQAAEEPVTAGDDNASMQQTNVDDNTNTTDKDGSEMTHNVFDQNKPDGGTGAGPVLSHDDMKSILSDMEKMGSLSAAVEKHCLSHGITDIESLFPEAKALTAAPEFFGRRTEWVAGVLNGARKTPFSRIKTHWADLNFDEARAKGYVKGSLKKEEFFGTASRITTPTTIYKKQKLDRDDIIDITDFDVVVWMKGEMRLMLEEEVARAILIGDGRAVDDEDKIPETNIRPVASDHEMYTVTVNVNLDDASSSYEELIEALTLARQHYRGTGLPTMYTTETHLARMLLLKDGLGRRLYSSVSDLATVLRVSSIVPVEVLDSEDDVVAILVNMSDYTVGADKGGQTTMFDDFDIDYNQYKYLIETRMSGALTKLKSAMVVRKVDSADALVTPNAPTFNSETGVVTIVATTGVVYKNDVTDATLSAGAQAPLADGATLKVRAEPASGYYLATSEGDTWQFTYHADA
jgi:HK97 family phage prohead protease